MRSEGAVSARSWAREVRSAVLCVALVTPWWCAVWQRMGVHIGRSPHLSLVRAVCARPQARTQHAHPAEQVRPHHCTLTGCALDAHWTPTAHPLHTHCTPTAHPLHTCTPIARSRYGYLDRRRVAAVGASYGGYMINWINGHNPALDPAPQAPLEDGGGDGGRDGASEFGGDGERLFKTLVNHDGLFDLRSMYYSTEELWFPEVCPVALRARAALRCASSPKHQGSALCARTGAGEHPRRAVGACRAPFVALLQLRS